MTVLRRRCGALRWSAAFAVAASTGGCATLLGEPAPPPSAAEIAAARSELVGLPASEVAERQVASVVEQIAAAASAIEPGLRWSRAEDRALGPCYGPYEHTGGRRVVLPRYRADGSLPQAAWPGFQETARVLAASVGATDMLPAAASSPEARHLRGAGCGGLGQQHPAVGVLRRPVRDHHRDRGLPPARAAGRLSIRRPARDQGRSSSPENRRISGPGKPGWRVADRPGSVPRRPFMEQGSCRIENVSLRREFGERRRSASVATARSR
ncbi:LppA family lipoprotein [Nocardia sp. CY41]|uniref:LppA family lipoprotein n=1 Tax=Nocardia sp. CY41 TaxID=2608686 RepID=UPI001359F45E